MKDSRFFRSQILEGKKNKIIKELNQLEEIKIEEAGSKTLNRLVIIFIG